MDEATIIPSTETGSAAVVVAHRIARSPSRVTTHHPDTVETDSLRLSSADDAEFWHESGLRYPTVREPSTQDAADQSPQAWA